MQPLVFNWEADRTLVNDIADRIGADIGSLERRHFPDGESYLRVLEECRHRQVFLIAGLNRPNAKLLPLLLAADTIRDLGAAAVGLVAPYLPYMRQDEAFKPGEGVTAKYVGRLLSAHFDWLVTVDPHLHRLKTLAEVYSIPASALQAAPAIARWLKNNVRKPLFIGPDSESEQWVADVASLCGADHLVLEKTRSGDRDVRVSVPDIGAWQNHTPVLVDDIISSGQTMVQALKGLVPQNSAAPLCVAVHGVFASGAEAALADAGAGRVVTTNTIAHTTNAIDVSAIIADGCGRFLRSA